MKDWEKLEPDRYKLLSKHYTKHAAGRAVQYVGVHYNAGNLTIDGCWSVWQTREASAHYQVEDDGEIGQLVYDKDIAWHLGVWDANTKSIGVEHANRADGTITETALDNGAHLVAAICKKYGLGRPEWLRNVFPHNYFKSTSCPGQIYGSQKAAYIERAQYWYDVMCGENVEKPAPVVPDTSTSATLGDYSYWGPKYTKETQRQLGTDVDGVVSRQALSDRKYAQNCETTSWVFTSKIVAANGYKGSMMVGALQTGLKRLGFYKGEIDNYAGKNTFTALQEWLESEGYSVGSAGCDGFFGADSCTAYGRALEDGIVAKLK